MDIVADLTSRGIVEVKDVVEPTSIAFKNLLKCKANLAEVRTFKYGALDRHYLDVYYPPKPLAGKTPLVFWIYGGGFVTGDRVLPEYDTSYTNIGAFFAQQGFITVIADYRLASKPWSAQYPKPVEDIRDAISWVVSNPQELTSSTTPNPDTESIFLIGHSAGGTHLGTLIFEPDVIPPGSPLRSRIKGAVLFAGLYYHDPTSLFEPEMKLYYGDKMESHSVLALLKSSQSKGLTKFPKFLLGESEHDPESFKIIRRKFHEELSALLQIPIPFLNAKDHNHISIPNGLGSGEAEEWGLEVAKWIRENM